MVKKIIAILFCLVLASTSFAAEFDADSDGVFDSTYKFKVDNLVHTATTAISANAITLLSQADFAGMRTQLSLVPGTNVQAYDADLTTYAGITPSADVQTLLGYANFAAIKGGLSIDDLVTLSGVADGATHLGTFTGTTITDNQTIKAALQLLETAVEAAGSGTVTAGTYIDVSGTEVSVDFTETDNITWGAAAGGSQTWTFDTGAGTDPTMAIDETTGFTFNKPVVATSFSTGGSATPGILLQDTDNAAGTATIYGNSSGGANDIILSIGVEDSTGESTPYIEVDGVSETIDLLKPVVTSSTVTTTGAVLPAAANTHALGSATAEWSDAYLGDGAVIYGQNDQSNTLTSGAAGWTMNLDLEITGADLTLAAAGVKLTGSNGSLTILGLGDGQDEDIKIDLNTTANTIEITSPASSATTIDINTLNLVATGQISGRLPVVADSDGKTLAGTDLYGSMQLATGAGTWVIPDVDASAGTGLSFCVYSTTAAEIVIDGNAEDKIRLGGTLGAAGGNITNATAEAAGDYVCLVLTDFDSDVAHWTVLGYKGTWTVP